MTVALTSARKRFPPVYCIYRAPRDFPHHWVVRVWWGLYPEPIACLCGSIGEAREQVPLGMVKLPNSAWEDPAIFESWI